MGRGNGRCISITKRVIKVLPPELKDSLLPKIQKFTATLQMIVLQLGKI